MQMVCCLGQRQFYCKLPTREWLKGVADHSDFREDALGRLRRTLSTVNQIAFGTKEAAEKMRARLRVVHGGVNGAISDRDG